MGKKYLVTGGAGFLGVNLAKLLSKKDEEVVIIDNLSTSYEYNLKSLPGDVDFIQADIVTIAMELIPKVDGIFHLASPVDLVFGSRWDLKS